MSSDHFQRVINGLLLLAALLSCSGCLILPYTEQKRLTDRETAQTIHPAELTYREITFADGRKFAIAGLQIDDSQKDHLQELDKQIHYDPEIPGLHKQEKEDTPPISCFVQLLDNGKAYVVVTNRRWPFHIEEQFWPTLLLVPIPVWRHPLREDLAMEAIRAGLAHAAPEELDGVRPIALEDGRRAMTLPDLQKAYLNAENEAWSEHRGIYRQSDRIDPLTPATMP